MKKEWKLQKQTYTGKLDDENFQEKLETCKHFIVLTWRTRDIVFHFTMQTLDFHFLIEKLGLVYNRPRHGCAIVSISAIALAIKNVQVGGCR